MNDKENRRTKMTKALIKNSFIELMQKQSIHKITVKDICGNADVNRSTFYAYYTDQYDLLNEIENEIFEKLKNIIKGSDNKFKESKVAEILKKIFEYMAGNLEICKLLINEQKEFDFQKKVWKFIMENFIQNLNIDNKDPRTIEYIYSFAISGCMGLIQIWMANGLDKSPEEMAEMLVKLIKNGFHAYS